MAPQPASESRTVVHMIGQAHLDPVWLWPWTEGRAEAIATSRSAVERLREYPDFQFTRGEALVYEWIEREDPAMFAEIASLIAQGRWHVVNGMVVQPDLNLPQGEAIVRQFLLGMAFFRDRFGVEPRVGYCVDTFGHPGSLPQILRGCGLDSYVFLRPGPHEKELAGEVFWWQGARRQPRSGAPDRRRLYHPRRGTGPAGREGIGREARCAFTGDVLLRGREPRRRSHEAPDRGCADAGGAE